MTNPWLLHVKKVKQSNPNLIYKDVLKKAKLSYKPVKKGGKLVTLKRKIKTRKIGKQAVIRAQDRPLQNLKKLIKDRAEGLDDEAIQEINRMIDLEIERNKLIPGAKSTELIPEKIPVKPEDEPEDEPDIPPIPIKPKPEPEQPDEPKPEQPDEPDKPKPEPEQPGDDDDDDKKPPSDPTRVVQIKDFLKKYLTKKNIGTAAALAGTAYLSYAGYKHREDLADIYRNRGDVLEELRDKFDDAKLDLQDAKDGAIENIKKRVRDIKQSEPVQYVKNISLHRKMKLLTTPELKELERMGFIDEGLRGDNFRGNIKIKEGVNILRLRDEVDDIIQERLSGLPLDPEFDIVPLDDNLDYYDEYFNPPQPSAPSFSPSITPPLSPRGPFEPSAPSISDLEEDIPFVNLPMRPDWEGLEDVPLTFEDFTPHTEDDSKYKIEMKEMGISDEALEEIMSEAKLEKAFDQHDERKYADPEEERRVLDMLQNQQIMHSADKIKKLPKIKEGQSVNKYVDNLSDKQVNTIINSELNNDDVLSKYANSFVDNILGEAQSEVISEETQQEIFNNYTQVVKQVKSLPMKEKRHILKLQLGDNQEAVTDTHKEAVKDILTSKTKSINNEIVKSLSQSQVNDMITLNMEKRMKQTKVKQRAISKLMESDIGENLSAPDLDKITDEYVKQLDIIIKKKTPEQQKRILKLQLDGNEEAKQDLRLILGSDSRKAYNAASIVLDKKGLPDDIIWYLKPFVIDPDEKVKQQSQKIRKKQTVITQKEKIERIDKLEDELKGFEFLLPNAKTTASKARIKKSINKLNDKIKKLQELPSQPSIEKITSSSGLSSGEIANINKQRDDIIRQERISQIRLKIQKLKDSKPKGPAKQKERDVINKQIRELGAQLTSLQSKTTSGISGLFGSGLLKNTFGQLHKKHFIKELYDHHIKGSGLFDDLLKIGKRVGKSAIKDATKQVRDEVLNKNPNLKKTIEAGLKITQIAKHVIKSDKVRKFVVNFLDKNTDEPSFKGELHAILKLPNKKFKLASYMGPFTQIMKRLRHKNKDGSVGVKALTVADMISMYHDVLYSLAKNTSDIRKADDKMIKYLKIAKNKKLDNPNNINLGLQLIKAKTTAEDMKLLIRGKFVDFNDNIPTEDIRLLEKWEKKLRTKLQKL